MTDSDFFGPLIQTKLTSPCLDYSILFMFMFKFMVRFSQSLIEVCGLCMKEGSNMGNILVEERINLYK